MAQNGGGGGGGGGKPKPQPKGGGVNNGLTMDQLWHAGWSIGKPKQQARRDVRLMLHPELAAIDRARTQATGDANTYATKVGGLYDALRTAMGQIGTGIDTDFGQVQKGYTKGANAIMEGLQGTAEGQPTTAPDQASFLGMLGSQLLGGQQEMSNTYQRTGDWNRASQEQGQIENLVTQRNIFGDLNKELGLLRDRKLDIQSQQPDMLKQRLDELRQLAFERMMGMKEYGLRNAAVQGQMKGDQAMRDWLMAQLNNAQNNSGWQPKWTPGQGNKPKGGGGGGGNGPGGKKRA